MESEQRTAGSPPDLLATRRGSAAVIALLALLFLAFRLALLVAREPFFDELFTLWITRKSFGGIVAALRSDSGPPLYYFVVRALGITTVTGGRILSLVCAAISLGAIVSVRALGKARFTAAALLAVFPPAVLFAVDARAYAMCAMFVTIAILLIDRGRPIPAALALVAAAYSHYYGVLFFPALLVAGSEGKAKSIAWRVAAAAFAALLFVPGFLLAASQPREAIAWMASTPRWPVALFAAPPAVLLVALSVVTLIASLHVNRFTAIAIVPVGIAAMFALAGRPVYFPLRFEAVLAPALALAVATSLAAWNPAARRALAAAVIALFGAIAAMGAWDHARRGPDDYRAAAAWVAANVPARARVVASGYLYLETLMAGRPGVQAYPAAQASHPGWRAPETRDPVPQPPFVWVGERGTNEFRAVTATHRAVPLYVNSRAAVLAVR